MTEENGESGLGSRLSSWKEIARFLKADVRTCQRWEQSSGLPVHRIQNAIRSRVYAWPRELEEWQKKAFQIGSEPAIAEPASPGEIPPEAGVPRKFAFKPAWLIAVLIPAVAAVFLVFSFRRDVNPFDFRIHGKSLIILNKSGRELWSYDTKLAHFQDERFYRFSFSGKAYQSFKTGDIPRSPSLLIRDIDGNGWNEVLFVPQTKSDVGAGGLHCFDHRGKEKWSFKAGKEMKIGDRLYAPDYVIGHLDVQDFNRDGRPEILVISHAYKDAPTQVVLLDLEKRILGEYWNFGRVFDFACADLNADGRPEIILAGANNGYSQPFLAVLEARDLRGASPQDSRSMFSSLGEGSERYYLRFANTELDLLAGPRAWLHQVRMMSNKHLTVETAVSFIRYDFDEALNPPQIIQADRGKKAYLEALQTGKIKRPYDEKAIVAEAAQRLLYYDGSSKSWVGRPAMANPWSAAKRP